MTAFEWSEDLETGIELIDEQHRQYGRFVNAFIEAYAGLEACTGMDVPQRRLLKAFGFLRAYAREHLGTEEALMQEYDYPAQAEHCRLHEHLVSWIEKTRERVETNTLDADFVMRVNGVLVEWFQAHIQTVDKRLTAYLRETAEERQDGKLLRLIKGMLGRS